MLCFSVLLSVLAGCASNQSKNEEMLKEFSFKDGVSFVDENLIKKEVREECNLLNNLSNALVKRSLDHGVSLTQGTKSNRTLSVKIATATPSIFVFGNASVPAVLNVTFEVREGDKVIIEKRKQCSTNLAGFMGLQPSACNKLNKCAENQAEFIARILEKI